MRIFSYQVRINIINTHQTIVIIIAVYLSKLNRVSLITKRNTRCIIVTLHRHHHRIDINCIFLRFDSSHQHCRRKDTTHRPQIRNFLRLPGGIIKISQIRTMTAWVIFREEAVFGNPVEFPNTLKHFFCLIFIRSRF